MTRVIDYRKFVPSMVMYSVDSMEDDEIKTARMARLKYCQEIRGVKDNIDLSFGGINARLISIDYADTFIIAYFSTEDRQFSQFLAKMYASFVTGIVKHHHRWTGTDISSAAVRSKLHIPFSGINLNNDGMADGSIMMGILIGPDGHPMFLGIGKDGRRGLRTEVFLEQCIDMNLSVSFTIPKISFDSLGIRADMIVTELVLLGDEGSSSSGPGTSSGRDRVERESESRPVEKVGNMFKR